MKALNLLVLVTLFAGLTAHADPEFVLAPKQTCSNAMGDGGYSIDDRGALAIVEENNIAGAREIARLKCKPTGVTGPSHPDGIATHSMCSGKGKDGKRYKVSFRCGGFAGGCWAELTVGKNASQRLSCQDNPQ